jgi:hypothetical protein
MPVFAVGCASSESSPNPAPTGAPSHSPVSLSLSSGSSNEPRNVEADVVVQNLDRVRTLMITGVQVAPAAGLRLVALRLVNASGPFAHTVTGGPRLSAPVSMVAETVRTLRVDFAVTGTCRQALRANPTVTISSHYQGQPAVMTTAVPRHTGADRGWALDALRNCEGL